MLKEGDKAPAFSTVNQDGKKVKLGDLKGKKIVLYFYPRDDTPGCTKEACGFRDSFSIYLKKGIVVLGVSGDDEISHKKFIKKFSLPFSLLADTDLAISRSYEVYRKKSMYGKTFMGIERTTFLIDDKGIIRKIFHRVRPEGHAEEILELF